MLEFRVRMTAKSKELYKQFKRSISSSNNGSAATIAAINSENPTGAAKYVGSGKGGAAKTWMHPPDVLLKGQVQYTVKYLGYAAVNRPKGADVVREAITAIRFNLPLKRSETGHSGAKLQKIDLQISVEGVILADAKTKLVLHQYPLQGISFCADDKQDRRLFSFIVKESPDSDRHVCHVFLSEKAAEQITLTIGEAFDLAYKQYLDRDKRQLEFRKGMLTMQKRINELLEARTKDEEKIAELVRRCHRAGIDVSDIAPDRKPAPPSGPVPSVPPPAFLAAAAAAESLGSAPTTGGDYMAPTTVKAENTYVADLLQLHSPTNSSKGYYVNEIVPSSSSLGPPPPLAPPPPIVPRRTGVQQQTTAQVHAPPPQASNVLTQQQLFDDNFDPRASEKKDSFGQNPFAVDAFLGGGGSTGNIDQMIEACERRLADFSVGAFLETGTTEAGAETANIRSKDDDDTESEYGTPLNAINQAVVTKTTTNNDTN